jgi:tetratricopeptide (TPR) repeat protein
MNETLRQYARERLDDAGEIDRWRLAHAQYYASWAHDVGCGLTGPDDVLWRARMRAELDNFRAAVGWALDRGLQQEQELALRILAPLAPQGRASADTSLDLLAVQAVRVADASRPELRAPVLALAGYHHWNQGRGELARSLAAAALRDGVVPRTLNPFEPYHFAVVFEMAAGNPVRALEIIDEARAALATIDDAFTEAYFLGFMANFQAMAGRIEQARIDAERALALARQIQNHYLLLNCLQGVAWAHQRDNPAAALAATDEFLHINRELEIDPRLGSSVLALAGGLRARLRDDTGALEILHRAVAVSRDQGTRPQLVAALDWALTPLVRTGRPDVAATLLGTLTTGALAEVSNFPGVPAARARTLERVRGTLGETKTDELLNRGASMTYDEVIFYAIEQFTTAST